MSATSLKKKVALAIVAPLVFLGVLEGVLRLLGHPAPAPLLLGFGRGDPVVGLSEVDRDTLWRLIPNRREPGTAYGITFTTNALGTRGPLPSVERHPNSFRVVCLGDSTAFGNLNTYPEELGRILAEAMPDRQIEVMNAGIPGFSARQGFEIFARDFVRYRPDLVTWCFGFNNARRPLDGRDDDAIVEERKREFGGLGLFARRSAIGSFLSSWLVPDRQSDRSARPEPVITDPDLAPMRVKPDRFAEITAATAALARSVGAVFVAIEQPHGFDRRDGRPLEPKDEVPLKFESHRLGAQHAALEDRCSRDGIPFVPMHRYFASLPDDDMFIGPCPFGDVIHASPIGLRYFAECLALDLARLGILPEGATVHVDHAAITAPSFAVADLDSDGVQELVAGTARDGHVELAVVEVERGLARRIALPLSPPTDSCALSQVPALGGATFVSYRNRETSIAVESLAVDDSAPRLAPVSMKAPPGVDWVRAVPVDLDGNGEPEYAIEPGPLATPQFLVLGENLGLLAQVSHAFDLGVAPALATAPDERHPGSEFLVIAGVSRGRGGEIYFGKSVPRPPPQAAHHFVLDRPCATFRVRTRTGETRRIVWRAPALFVEHAGLDVSVVFPWGAVACDHASPRLGLVAPCRGEPSGGIVVAARTGRRLEWTRIDARGVQPVSITELAEHP